MTQTRIGILVVHGVGEQKHFEHLESIAGNLFKALESNPEHNAHIQIRRADQIQLYAPTENWRDAPVVVSWRPLSAKGAKGDGVDRVEAVFREVHWADLDMPPTVWNWLNLVFWALGVPGVRLFTTSTIWEARKDFMRPPHSGLAWWQVLLTRAQLFGVSLLFFLMLFSVELLYFALRRLSLRARSLGTIHALVHDFLGDVKLYQDWFVRWDSHLETLGEKSRVAIRRRMVRALVQTAAEVEAGQLDGYYIFAHSLGTVAAFNGLMELNVTLPNYFTQEEWNGLPASLKARVAQVAPAIEQPRRPSWLDPHDALNRPRLFAGLRGFLTMGSPLDKFAALWPIIVPVNQEPIPNNIPWVNVDDARDIVASKIDLFESDGNTLSIGGAHTRNIGGLQLRNITWVDQPVLFTAHTSYWKVGPRQDRLINRLIPWLEGGAFQDPVSRYALWMAYAGYAFSFVVLGVLSAFVSAVIWCLATANLSAASSSSLADLPRLMVLEVVNKQEIPVYMATLVTAGSVVVFVCAVVRYAWELCTINPIQKMR